MKIKLYFDVVCPFSYMGKRQLERSLDRFKHRNEVEVSLHTFHLSPDAAKNTGKDIYQLLSSGLGISYEEAKQNNARVAMQAKEIGLNYQFDTMIPTNSYDALRLSHYAKEKGRMQEMVEVIMKAYFVDSMDIGDHSTLARLARETGLNEKESLEVLAGDRYGNEVKNDKQNGINLGVRGVPYFIINDKYSFSGAQPIDTYLDVFQRAWNEDRQNN